MNPINVATNGGAKTAVQPSFLEELSGSFRGRLLAPGDSGYDEARTIWNGMIDRKPGLIARCTGVADVIAAVNFARENNLLTTIHGGGHNIAGYAVCDDGLMIDLSLMKSVRVEPESRLVHVQPGATLGDLDHETQAFGLATPVGINSTTGVAGLTLGGGFGWLSRKYGLTIDNLSAADVVTADGKLLRANEWENQELFWAIRGGGGNFGVVTRFEFRLHPVGPSVYAGLIVYSLDEARQVLEKYREIVPKLGDETSVWVVMRKAPPLPFLPESVHGKEIVVLACFHGGDPSEGEKAISPFRSLGNVLGEFLGTQPYAAWQQAFDPLLTPGARNYWKSHNFTSLTDAAIDIAIDYVSRLPNEECEIFFGMLGAEVNRKGVKDTAYPHRKAEYIMNVHGRWRNMTDDERCTRWARGLYKDMAPCATGGVYVNFLTADETDRVQAAYGENYDRLKKAKKTYDPENLFRMNQNILPGR
ncbi:MAG: FAD-binding oxidoreductase [Candidatus Zixiibacteriota bacterium]